MFVAREYAACLLVIVLLAATLLFAGGHDDIPVEVGLIVDNSGSMRPKRREVINAALTFARSSNPQDQMFVVNFNENVSYGLPQETPFTDQVAPLELALSSRQNMRANSLLIRLSGGGKWIRTRGTVSKSAVPSGMA